jgi:hypothetical protein
MASPVYRSRKPKASPLWQCLFRLWRWFAFKPVGEKVDKGVSPIITSLWGGKIVLNHFKYGIWEEVHELNMQARCIM